MMSPLAASDGAGRPYVPTIGAYVHAIDPLAVCRAYTRSSCDTRITTSPAAESTGDATKLQSSERVLSAFHNSAPAGVIAETPASTVAVKIVPSAHTAGVGGTPRVLLVGAAMLRVHSTDPSVTFTARSTPS